MFHISPSVYHNGTLTIINVNYVHIQLLLISVFVYNFVFSQLFFFSKRLNLLNYYTYIRPPAFSLNNLVTRTVLAPL